MFEVPPGNQLIFDRNDQEAGFHSQRYPKICKEM